MSNINYNHFKTLYPRERSVSTPPLATFAGGGGGVILVAAGTGSSIGTVVSFADSNNVSFGISNGSITASASYLAQSVQTQNLVSVQGSTGAIVFSNSNNITFGGNNSTVTASFSQSVQPINFSAGTQSSNLTDLAFSNAHNITFGLSNGTITASASSPAASAFFFSNQNGVSFGTAGSTVTATVKTDYQSSGNYLTTAMASNRGSDFVQATAVFAGTNATGTIASGGISMSVAAQSAQTGISSVVLSNTTYTSGEISFRDGNGLSWASGTGQGISLTHGLQFTSATSAITSLAINTSQSSLFQHTSATSAITSNAINTSQSSLFQHTSATSAITSLAVNTSSPRIQGIAASNTTYTSGSVTLRDLNGISWQSTTGQQIQITHALQFTSATSAITASAINTSQSSLFQHTSATSAITSAAVHTSSPRIQAIYDGANSISTGTIRYTNANGVTFSINGQILSGSVATTYRASNDAVGLNTALTANGVAWTVNSSGISLNVPAFLTTAALSNHSHGNPTLALTNLTGTTASASNGFTLSLSAAPPSAASINASAGTTSNNLTNLVFGDGNGVSFGLDGSTVTASVVTNYLTTAAQSTQTFLASLGGNTGTTNSSRIGNGAFVFAGGNGVTINQSNNSVSWSVETAYQSQGAYLTTAALSTQTLMISVSGNVGTTNSSRISNGGYVLAGGNGVTLNQSNNSLSISVETAYQSQGAYLTTAAQSNHSHGNPTLALTNLTGTTASASNGFTLSLSGPAAGITTAALSSQTLAFTLSGNVATTNSSQILNGGYALAGGNGVTLQQSNNTVSVSVATNYQSQGAYLTTAAQSTQTLGFTLGGNIATTNSSQVAAGGYILAGGNGVTIQQSNNTVSLSVATAYQSQGAYLTTAAQSTQTNAFSLGGNTGTTNSSVMGAGGYVIAGGSNVTLSMSNNSLSIHAATNALTTAALSNHSHGNPTLALTNLTGTTASASNGFTLSLSAAAPGAAAENNAINLLGANTAGNTTATGSTIGWSGINLTLSGTNNSIVNISAPATSSLSGTGVVSISVNGSTVFIGVPVTTFNSSVFGKQLEFAQSSSSIGQNTLYFFPEIIHDYVQGSIIKIPVLITATSTNVNSSAPRGFTASVGVYTRQTGTNSTALTRIYSTSYTLGANFSSNSATVSIITGLGNSTSYSTTAPSGTSASNLVHGARELLLGMATTFAPGEYWFGYAHSTSSGNTNPALFQISHVIGSSQTGNAMGVAANASLIGIQQNIGLGTYSATSGGWPAAITFTEIRGGATWPIMFFLNNTN